MENPAVSVKIGRVVRLLVDCLLAHCAGLLELLALRGKIPGIVVQHRGIVRIESEGLVVALEGSLFISHGVGSVPDA